MDGIDGAAGQLYQPSLSSLLSLPSQAG